MADVLNRGWLAQNESRSYPLAPWATRRDVTGSFALPDDFLCGLSLGVSAGLVVDETLFYVSSISSTTAGYVVTIGYAGTPAVPAAATAAVAASALAGGEFVPVALSGAGDFADCSGRLVVGTTRGILLQPPGLWSFDLVGGQLDVDCLVPQYRGVSALYVSNGVEVLGPFYGDVALAAGTNFAIGYGPAGLTLSAISGAGLSAPCACESDPASSPPIGMINGIPASTANGFTLRGDSCVTVGATASGFQLSDACSTPCCGPTELAALAAQLGRLAGDVETLRQFLARLQAAQATTNQAVLASKVGDQGCLTCG